MCDVAEESMMQPLQLLQEDENGVFNLDVMRLEEIFKDEMLQGRRIVTICVVGAFRKGKSFLLNVVKNHLDVQGAEGWTEAPLSGGFPCRAGATRETSGVLVWPQVFLRDDNLAVMLLDTQGLFDEESSYQKNSFVFTFATLLSSLQIFNVSQQIQMDDMMHLQVFLELGRLMMEFDSTNPFQKLIFLVRDWPHRMDFDYGLKGGQAYLKKKWLNNDVANVEKQKVCQTLTECFSDVQCCLLGYPGKTIAEGISSAQLQKGEPEFVKHLSSFVRTILSEEWLTPKRVSGVEILAEDFVNYVRNVFQSLKSNAPPTQAMLQCMAMVSNSELSREGVAEYIAYMTPRCKEAVENLNAVHEEAVASAQNVFDSRRKLGGDSFAMNLRNLMMQDIQQQYVNFSAVNEVRKQDAILELQRLQCETPETAWRNLVFSQQQRLFTLLGDRRYDQIPTNDVEQILERKVGFAKYGPPTFGEGIGYSEEQENIIRETCEKIRKNKGTDGNIYFSSICIYWVDLDFKETKVSTIFRILMNETTNKFVFIDDSLRVYTNWDKYISNNKLPKCQMCFPLDGIYTADRNNLVQVIFQESNACGVLKQISTVFSGIAIGAMITSAVIASATLVTPVVAPLLVTSAVCGVGSSSYTLADSVITLVDRSQHDQSINITNLESALAWLSIGASPLCFASSFMVLKQEIPLLGKLFQTATTFDDFIALATELGTKSLCVITYLGTLLNSLVNGDLTSHTIQQIQAYLLYYFHIFVGQNAALGDLGESLANIMVQPLHNLPQSASVFILGLMVCATPKEIVEQLRNRGIGSGSQSIAG